MTPRIDFERFLNIRSAYGPAFQGEGGRVSFVTNITGLPQLWAVDGPGAWPAQLTFLPERVLYGTADHQHRRMILGTDLGGNEHVQLLLLDPGDPTPRPLTASPDVIHTFGGWSPDDALIAFADNSREAAYFDIYTLTVDEVDAEPRRVYQQDGSNSVAAWAPDGTALIVAHTEKPANQDLYLVPLDGGEPRLLTPHRGDAVYDHVEWAPDGRSLYLSTDQDREFTALVRYDLESGAWETLAAPDWDVEGCWLSPDGARLAYVVNVDGYSELYVRDLVAGTDTQAAIPRGVAIATGSSAMSYAPGLAWAPDSRRLAFSFTQPTRSLDIWLWDLDGGDPAPLTRSGMAGIPAAVFTEPALVHYPTFDGREIPAFLYRPPGASEGQGPCVVLVHGGPEGQSRPTFDPVIAYLVHRGYAVFVPNVRGSTGYGR
ncbi:MAG TPA: DPP IV N-terminal domain-containing protein, partial [Chloroflexia bacterium]|nr:DPP IV N-terminal domain-containing protein [Chloroflexia bacterium]